MRQNYKKKISKKRRKKKLIAITSMWMLSIGFIAVILIFFLYITQGNNVRNLIFSSEDLSMTVDSVDGIPVKQMLLTPNPYSRPKSRLRWVNGVVIHYTANPGTDAEANRNYFENLKSTHETYSSSHFVIGIHGEIIQCIPLNEISYASNERNEDTISIECCHLDKTGEFTKETYESLVALTAWICKEYHLKEDEIIRHYDVTGKLCTLYYVDHEDQWITFKEDVMDELKNLDISE